MMNIDFALRYYTDMINADKNIDMAFFQNELSAAEFAEFQELIPFINLVKSTRLNHKFQKTFETVDVSTN